MGIKEFFVAFRDAIDGEYDRRVKAASEVREYNIGGHGHHDHHDADHGHEHQDATNQDAHDTEVVVDSHAGEATSQH
ncbi:hypothetical protein [Herpetosiphon giganteus]|uniref:hypothetical protein n=1 Tax=Herpetosiphon giganteus TaxID=2029754 RepID=UPI00195ECA03|nr:hypothetical protein [Herpetosiphon giganteus]MBM7844523.1 ABC-type Zn2+ transport system substrate-binding protein/surface adhesin [Herpetosiphon giganteus]